LIISTVTVGGGPPAKAIGNVRYPRSFRLSQASLETR
jgi:hypothetical protein